ncbi:MAG: hypothetical protein LBS55_06525 [Prevotellaceae bacterium]|jgi:hypothetical protein|nr:hypothetical protein [Prevotellaceae bacterium]
MTVRDYIASKTGRLNLNLTDADWSDISKSVDLGAEDTEDNIRKAYMVLATRIFPFYVNQAKSVSENGFSISFDGNGLLNFYSWLCKYLGIKNNLTQKPRVTFR